MPARGDRWKGIEHEDIGNAVTGSVGFAVAIDIGAIPIPDSANGSTMPSSGEAINP